MRLGRARILWVILRRKLIFRHTKCFEISNVDIFDSTVRGHIKNCDIFTSDIEDSFVFESNLFGMTSCKDSKIQDCYISKNVEIDNCYVFGTKGVFSGNMAGGVCKEGHICSTACRALWHHQSY